MSRIQRESNIEVDPSPSVLLEMKCSVVLLLGVTVVSVFIGDSEPAKILGLFHFNGKSHFIMFEALLKGLAARGHQVYVVGHFPQKKHIPNYTDINVADSLPAIMNNFTIEMARGFGYINLFHFLWNTNRDMCKSVLQHPKVQSLINGDTKFDLIITEIFGTDCFIGLSHRFKVPFISMISSVILPWGNDRVGNPDHPAYIPNYFLPYPQHMTLGQRIINTVMVEALKLGHYYFAELPMNELARQNFGQDLPPIAELKKKTRLILANSHFSLNIPRPTVPPFIEVGGLHIQRNGKLPKDLGTFINESKDGVIYFSLGSLVRAETLPKDKLQAFISAFSELPQRVIWKTDDIVGLPDNVRTSKWYPQFEILSHPNVRVFITHGGLMGTQEAVYAGVPMVGIPLFADQELNIRNCMAKGTAVLVLYDSITKETISSALRTVLSDPSYRKNAEKLSRLFRDRPQTPLETAIFWTEYVIRHGGAPHLRSAAMDLTWYQYLLIDVIAVIMLCVIIVLGSLYAIFRKIISICSGSISRKLKSN